MLQEQSDKKVRIRYDTMMTRGMREVKDSLRLVVHGEVALSADAHG